MSDPAPVTPLHVLIPYDGSQHSKNAINQLRRLVKRGLLYELHLLNVQPPLSGDVTRFLPKGNVQSYHQEQGDAVLSSAHEALAAAGLSATSHVRVGQPAAAIVQAAQELKIDLILMGTHGRGGMAELFLGSVATGVLQGVQIPVTLVR